MRRFLEGELLLLAALLVLISFSSRGTAQDDDQSRDSPLFADPSHHFHFTVGFGGSVRSPLRSDRDGGFQAAAAVRCVKSRTTFRQRWLRVPPWPPPACSRSCGRPSQGPGRRETPRRKEKHPRHRRAPRATISGREFSPSRLLLWAETPRRARATPNLRQLTCLSFVRRHKGLACGRIVDS